MPDTLTAGREAFRRHDWDAALEAMAECDADSGLSPDDLLLLADAYWWSARPEEAVEVFERAFAEFMRAGRAIDAATTGALLAYLAIRRQNASVAGAWMSRIEPILEDAPPSPAHGWLKILHVGFALFVRRDIDAALAAADEAIDLAHDLGLPGVQSLAMSFKGTTLIHKGLVDEGMALIDEATVVAMTEGTDLRAASDVYCNTIAACAVLADYRRAGEWEEEATRWMATNSVGGYVGVCEVHRAEMKRVRGSWSEAEEYARRACTELERFRLMDGIGFAWYEIGEVRRRMGDLDAAEAAFTKAYEYGHGAQPGLSLLMADRGDLEGAADSIARALERRSSRDGDSTARLSVAKLLPAQVEIALAAGEAEAARDALAELKDIAETYPNDVWKGYALACEGAVELGAGDAAAAVDLLKQSWVIWRDSDMPYESAKARMLLGIAWQAAGDQRAARLELNAARSTFERLGAARDIALIADLLGEDEPHLQQDRELERVTRTFVFTDIVTSTDLIGLIGDTPWESLLKWHDRTLRAVFADHDGEEVRHTGDGFFVAFAAPRAAIDAAVDVQRRLASHRHEHGFAPRVRIGMHLAEATRESNDYSGRGVHLAARVGALADGEEILASQSVLDAAGTIPYSVTEPRTVELKGIAEPVDVRNIAWR